MRKMKKKKKIADVTAVSMTLRVSIRVEVLSRIVAVGR